MLNGLSGYFHNDTFMSFRLLCAIVLSFGIRPMRVPDGGHFLGEEQERDIAAIRAWASNMAAINLAKLLVGFLVQSYYTAHLGLPSPLTSLRLVSGGCRATALSSISLLTSYAMW